MASGIEKASLVQVMERAIAINETPAPLRQPRGYVRSRLGEYLIVYRAEAKTQLDLVQVISGELPADQERLLRVLPASPPEVYTDANRPAATVAQATISLLDADVEAVVYPVVPSRGHNDLVFEGDPRPGPDSPEPTWSYRVEIM